jgi:putative ABC transport system permease protein
MFSLQRTLSLGYIRKRWTRTVLIVLSIALGVATVVATRALHASLKKSARDAINPLSHLADLIILNGQTGVPLELATRLREANIEGVADLQPLTVARVLVPELDNRSVWLLGVSLDPENAKRAATAQAGDNAWGVELELTASQGKIALLYLQGKAAAVTPELAEALGSPGRPFRVRLAGEEQPCESIALVRLGEQAKALGSNVVFVDIWQAGALVFPERRNYAGQFNVTLQKGADRARVQRQLQELVGTQGVVRTIEANDELTMDVTAGLELGFLLGSAGALIVGLFLVYNALSVSVAERRHDIGILRSVGATRFQIAMLFVNEATFLGLIGALLGLPLGYGLAWVSLAPINRLINEIFIPIDARQISVSVRVMLLAMAAGIGTAMFAALVPAIQAAQEEPADAVRRVPRLTPLFLRLLHLACVALLVGAGFGCVLLREQLPPRGGVFAGIVFLLVGALTATPILATMLGRFFQPVFRSLLGLEGRLAADNLIRSPGRTGLVIAAIAATGAMLIQTAGFIRSSKVAFLGWLRDNVGADLYVTAGDTITRAAQAVSLSGDFGRQLEEVPGVETALPVRLYRIDYRDRIVLLLSLDLDTFHGTDRDNALVRDLNRYPRLRQPGTALISENFAALYGIRPGQTLTIPGRSGPVDLEVLGTFVDYTWNRGTILVSHRWLEEEFADTHVDVYDVYLTPGADPDTVRREIVKRWNKSDAIFAETADEFCTNVAVQLDRVYLFAYAQQVVIGLVALLGVIGALFISVLQRRRELGLMRAVGAGREQVLWSVLAEAGLMGAIGSILGVIVGLALEWYVLRILLLDEAGFLFPMYVPWREAGLVVLASILLPLLVGIWPALQATRVRIADAIAYE